MKKISMIILIAAGLGLNTFGQPLLEKGTILLGGNLNLSFDSGKSTYGDETTDGPKYHSVIFYPQAGYFVADNFAAGIGVGYQSYGYKDEDEYGTDKHTSSMFLAGLFARYYVKPLTHAACFGELNFNFGTGKVKDEYDDAGRGVMETDEYKQSMFGINLKPGATVFISNKLALDFTYGSLGYMSYTAKDEESDETSKETSSNFTVSFNPGTFTFGVFYYFN